MQNLSRKFTVALISTFIFSFAATIVSYAVPAEQSLTFSTRLLTFVVLSAPMFLIAGVLASYVFESVIRSAKTKWFSYIIIGAVFAVPYALYSFPGADLMQFSLMGAAGAALFCSIQLICHRYLFKSPAKS